MIIMLIMLLGYYIDDKKPTALEVFSFFALVEIIAIDFPIILGLFGKLA